MTTFNFGGFSFDATETDAFVQYWYNITNYSAPLTRSSNECKEILYWIGEFLSLSYIVNVTTVLMVAMMMFLEILLINVAIIRQTCN